MWFDFYSMYKKKKPFFLVRVRKEPLWGVEKFVTPSFTPDFGFHLELQCKNIC